MLNLVETLPQTFLGNLAIRECNTIAFDVDAGTWNFGCGLVVSDELAGQDQRGLRMFGEMHRQHHAHAIPFRNGSVRPWQIMEIVNTTDLSETITVSCNCPHED